MAKVKVSQDTIDKIKKMGMTKALAGIKSTSGAEYKEAVRRMYGERRLEKALGGGYAPGAKHVSDPTNYTSKSKNQAPPKTAAYFAGRKPGKLNTAAATAASTQGKSPKQVLDALKKPTPKPKAKKDNGPAKNASVVDKLKWIGKETLKQTGKDVLMFGAGGASAGASLGAKAALKAGAVAAKRGALSTSGRVAAKAGKAVSQSQYDAMLATASKVSKVKTAASKAASVPAKVRGTADSARAAATSAAGRVSAKTTKSVTPKQYDAMKAAAAKKGKK